MNHLFQSLASANYFWVILSCVFALIALISRAARWNILIETSGYNPDIKHSFYALNIGYVSNMAFPRLGEITRCGSLNKTQNIPMDLLVGTVILERIIDLVCLLLLVAIVFFAKFEMFGNFFINEVFQPLIKKFNFPVEFWYVLLGIIFLSFSLIFFFRKKLMKIKIIALIWKFIKGATEGFISVFKMKKSALFLVHTIIIWIMYFLMTYVVFFALETTNSLGPIDGLFIMIVGGLGMSAPVQGGFGTFHWMVSLGLMLFGIPKDDGLIFATLVHETQALFLLILGGLSFLMIFLEKKNAKSV
jgi:glycosyltransferase 2 family protein